MLVRRKLIEDQKTILELSDRTQELQNEVYCMNDSIDFQDAESVRSGNSHVTSRPVSFPPHPIFWRDVEASFRRIESMEFINWGAAPFGHNGKKWKARTKSRSEMTVWTVSLRFIGPKWGRLSKYLWGRPTTTEDFWSSLWQVPHTNNLCLLEDKIQDRGMYLFTISYGSDAMDQRSGVGWFSGWFWDLCHLIVVFQYRISKCSMRGLLQRWTKSSIIPNSKGESFWRNKQAQKEDHFLRSKQIAHLVCDHFRVTGTHDSVKNCADLFTISPRSDDDVQEFDSKWEGILLSRTKIPHDDILEGLCKLRIRESEKLKTVLELYDLETPSGEVRTWLSQIENYDEKKYRARHSK